MSLPNCGNFAHFHSLFHFGQDVTDQVKVLESLSVQMQPVRLEYAKLKKRLDTARESLDNITRVRSNGEDAVEICLENQVIKRLPSQSVDMIKKCTSNVFRFVSRSFFFYFMTRISCAFTFIAKTNHNSPYLFETSSENSFVQLRHYFSRRTFVILRRVLTFLNLIKFVERVFKLVNFPSPS